MVHSEIKEKCVTDYTSTVMEHRWGFDAVVVSWKCFNENLQGDKMGNFGLPVEVRSPGEDNKKNKKRSDKNGLARRTQRWLFFWIINKRKRR